MKSLTRGWKRRSFLSGLAAAPVIRPVAGHANQAFAQAMNLAVVGLGRSGMTSLQALKGMPMFRVAALCDVDAVRLDAAAKAAPDARLFRDFREMLQDKSIDAVVVATPSQWSAYVAIFAMANGKDVYAEAPIAQTIRETQAVAQTTARHGRVLFSGSPARSYRLLEDLEEKIEALGQVHFINAVVRPQKVVLPKENDTPEPASVDYDKWLGPVLVMPFNVNHFHGRWPYFWEFGGGIMTGQMLRLLDVVTHATPLDFESRISLCSQGATCWPSAAETPDTMAATFEFKSGLTLTTEFQAWHATSQGYQLAWYGERGRIVLSDDGLVITINGIVDRRQAEVKAASVYGLEDLTTHFKAFYQAVVDRRRDLAVKARNGTLLAHLGNAAYRTGQSKEGPATLEFMPAEMAFVSPEANKFLSMPRRKGFSVEL